MRRWNSRYRFAWTPIITFGTRRLAFLEWVERELDPVAFSEGPEYVGVALADRRLRITVSASGMTLEDGFATDAGVTPLRPAVEGIFEIMEPKAVSLRSAAVAWSSALSVGDYEEACALFAQAVSGLGQGGTFRPVDASVLMDLVSPSAEAQVEWGIVEAAELLERVTQPSVGRIGEQGRGATDITSINAQELPATSLFVDGLIHKYSSPGDATSAEGVYSIIETADLLSREFATDLAASFNSLGKSTS